MFPTRHHFSSSGNGYRSRNSRQHGRRSNDRNGLNCNQRDRRQDRRQKSPPSRRESRRFEAEENAEIMRLRKIAEDATAKFEELKQKEQERIRQEEIDTEAQSQSFGPYGDASSNSEDDGGGAPIYVAGDKRKRPHESSASSSHQHRNHREKRRRYSNDEGNVYKFLQNLKIDNPRSFNHTVPESVRTAPPRYEEFQRRKPKKVLLDTSVLAESVEYEFPYKEPTEVSAGVYRIEEVPYDPNNGASVERNTAVDWRNISYDDYIAMDVIRQNIFVQSSITPKLYVLRYRIRKATIVKEKIGCYIQLVNLEDDRVKEVQKTEKLSRRFSIVESKLKLIKEGIRVCGENVDLRLLEIDILIASKDHDSEDVKNAWKKLMRQFPNDLKMWRQHLTYYRNHIDVFNSSSYIKDSIIPCLTSLCSILNRTSYKPLPMQVGTEDFIVDVIVAAATLYIESGKTYKAIGILQALTEFYFLVPERIKTFDFKKKLTAFECYWETPIPKVGHVGAVGWNRVTSNITYTNYNFPQNQILSAKDEEKIHNSMAKYVYYDDLKYCKNNKHESNCEVWSKIEQHRTSSFWEPTYNSCSQPQLYKHYNSFADIKPFLLELPKGIVKPAVYKILMKFGAVFPDLQDYSQESIFQRCGICVYNKNSEMKYSGMDKFIDNVLCLMSGVDEEMYLYGTVARLMTSKAFILNNHSYSTPEEAKDKFMNDAEAIFENCIRPPDNSEFAILKSYGVELQRKIFLHFSNDAGLAMPYTDGQNSIPNIFDPEIPPAHLLASLQYCVMLCRDLPHYDETTETSNSKLKFLMKIFFPNDEAVDYQSKASQEKAIKQWQNIKLHETVFNLPSGTRWIGDINIFALELFSTLCYEVEEDPLKKFEAFDQFYSITILKDNEDLAEAYFKTWNYHLNYYYEEKTTFMNRLKEFIVNIFPRNSYLTMMYIANLRQNEAETRCFFLLNESEEEDDVVKVLRSVIQIAVEYENKRKCVINQALNNRYFYEILKNAADCCSNGIIPASFLWRFCLFFVKHSKKTEFCNLYQIARDQCPWSKILLIYAASLSTSSEFVNDIERAKKIGIELMTSIDEIKEMQ